MFIVGAEAVPEAEWWAMVPDGVSVHAARVSAPAPWAAWRADRAGVELAEDVARGCRQFAAMQVAAVVVGHSSSSILGGRGWDEAVVAAMAPLLPASCLATTNGLDCLAALGTVGVRRPFLVLPPWFNDATVSAGVQYYTDRGVTPAGHLRYDPGPGWRDMPPGELYARGMGLAQQVEPLHAQIRAACPAEADGVLIAGTGLRCVAIIEALEQDLARPVVTANQASLWHCLRRCGVAAEVAGYGRLLQAQSGDGSGSKQGSAGVVRSTLSRDGPGVL